ncbi:MAG: HD-GYP domain-containing protein [Phycisphaerae bacterium]
MTDTDGHGPWEEDVDQALADLIDAEHARGGGSYAPDGADATTAPTPAGPSDIGRPTGAGARVIAAPNPVADSGDAGATFHDTGATIDVDGLSGSSLDTMSSGMTLSQDIYTESGVLLLAAGKRITTRFLELLRRRGITRVRLGPRDDAVAPERADEDAPPGDDLHTLASRALDERAAGALLHDVVFHPVRRWRRPQLSVDDLKHEAALGVEMHSATSAAVADLCSALDAGRRVSTTEVRRAVHHFVNKAALDFDLLPHIVALQQTRDEYLFDHCVNVALMSIAMALQLGLDHDTVTAIGLGGMLHDIGMLRVPASIRLAERPLTEREWHEIHRHPLHTLDMLTELGAIPQAAKFMAYQAHERMNGSGYPRRRHGKQLHMYARIVALSDAYSAMTSDRPYRRAIEPYIAARTVLTDGAAGKFDGAIVRAFLDTVSLFPVGSHVLLSDGSAARVLRAAPDQHTRPIVETLGPDGSVTGQILDLSDRHAPRVVKATM